MTRADKRARQKERTRQAREARETALKRQRRKTAAIRFGIGAAVVIAGIVVITLITGDDGDDTSSTSTTLPTTETTTEEQAAETATEAVWDPAVRCAPDGGSGEPEVALDPETLYTATIATNQGEIVAELDTVNAPIGAAHFIKLAQDGFYDGLTWHRVIDDFMIQGGDPNGDGTGGTGNPGVSAEPSTNGYPLGSLAAAKTGADPAGTFDAQFFITTGDQGVTLSNDYACFGSVTSGFEVAQGMDALQAAGGDAPSEELTIDSIEITESPRATDATTTTIAG